MSKITKNKKNLTYLLNDSLIRLVLTLLVSIATTKRSFSTKEMAKNKLINMMEDERLANSIISYIERRIIKKFVTNFVIN